VSDEETVKHARVRELCRRIRAIDTAVAELEPYRNDLCRLFGTSADDWLPDALADAIAQDPGPAGLAFALDGNIENGDWESAGRHAAMLEAAL
jgi:hypothetical protein